MIGLLRGKVLSKKPPFAIIDVGGVGYELQASMHTFYSLPDIEQQITLYTHLQQREDGLFLFGFAEERERFLFRELIKVSGVGPKLALAILSGMQVGEFLQCLDHKDVKSLVGLPGVGKKTAERLIIEMRDRLIESSAVHEQFSEVLLGKDQSPATNDNSVDAINALISLGYKPLEAKRVVGKLSNEADDSESLIRLALQSMAKGSK